MDPGSMQTKTLVSDVCVGQVNAAITIIHWHNVRVYRNPGKRSYPR